MRSIFSHFASRATSRLRPPFLSPCRPESVNHPPGDVYDIAFKRPDPGLELVRWFVDCLCFKAVSRYARLHAYDLMRVFRDERAQWIETE